MKRTLNHYSQSFKQQVLDDYFQSGIDQHECAQKWKIPQTTLSTWLCVCKNRKKVYLCTQIRFTWMQKTRPLRTCA